MSNKQTVVRSFGLNSKTKIKSHNKALNSQATPAGTPPDGGAR